MDKVKELTGGRGVDIVYDPIGDKVADESLRCLAWGGRLLILGFLGGGPTNIRSNYLLIKGIDAVGVRIGVTERSQPRAGDRQYEGADGTGGAGEAEAAHFAPVPSRPGGGGDTGGDRSCRDRQGGSGQLESIT